MTAWTVLTLVTLGVLWALILVFIRCWRARSVARRSAACWACTPKTPVEWCNFYGVSVSRGSALVFKAVEDDWQGQHKHPGIVYRPGVKVVAPDWDPSPACGGGLHFSPHPFMGVAYCNTASRFVACRVRVADMVVLGDKVKAPRCTVLFECDEDGRKVENTEAAA